LNAPSQIERQSNLSDGFIKYSETGVCIRNGFANTCLYEGLLIERAVDFRSRSVERAAHAEVGGITALAATDLLEEISLKKLGDGFCGRGLGVGALFLTYSLVAFELCLSCELGGLRLGLDGFVALCACYALGSLGAITFIYRHTLGFLWARSLAHRDHQAHRESQKRGEHSSDQSFVPPRKLLQLIERVVWMSQDRLIL
jgi:hypothetical protein